MADRSTLRKFEDKDYRDGFLHATVRGWIAYQVQALREKLKLTQTDFAARVGTTQTVISRMENDKGVPNVQTLLDMASALDVALVVQFVPYPEFLDRTSDMSPAALQPATIHETLSARIAPQPDMVTTFWVAQAKTQTPVRGDELYRNFLTHANKPVPQGPDLRGLWDDANQGLRNPLNEIMI